MAEQYKETTLPSGAMIRELVSDGPRPAQAPRLSVLAFKRLLAPAERVAIRQARKTDPLVDDFLDLLDTTALSGSEVHLDDPDLIAGLSYMTSVGLLTQARADEILGG